MRTVLPIATFALTLCSASAFAEPRPAAGPSDAARMVTDDCARARKAGKTCVLEVAAEDVGGATPAAGDAGFRAVTFHPEASLIRIRRDFLPEIVKAAEDL